MDSATNHSAHHETVAVWQRWRRARHRRERDNAALKLWQLCENEIWGAAKVLASKFGGDEHITVPVWRLRNGLSEDDVRYAAFPAVMKAAKGFDPGKGAAFQTYAFKFILGELRSLVAVEDVLFSTTESVLFESGDGHDIAEDEQPTQSEPRDMWYLLEVDSENGGPGQRSDLGNCLTDAHHTELRQLQGWLEENRERAIEKYGYGKWDFLHFYAGWAAMVDEMPPEHRHRNLFEGMLSVGPLQGVTIRADGKKWDQMLPVQADILLRAGVKKSVIAKELGQRWSTFKDMKKRMEDVGLDSSRFTPDQADAAVRGKPRGRPPKKPST
jgi:hypothetical protein